MKIDWQSRVVLLLVLPAAGADVVIQSGFWAEHDPHTALWGLGICAFFAVLVLLIRAGTPRAAATGFAVGASLIFSTAPIPFSPLHTALTPAFFVFAFAVLATRFGRRDKESIGLAEAQRGRSAAQVAANLGAAMFFAEPLVRMQFLGLPLGRSSSGYWSLLLAPTMAALCEAAADTVSSEIGQALSLRLGSRLGTRTRLVTTLRTVAPGTNGGISLYGSLAGITAALCIALAGSWALQQRALFFWLSATGGVFGLFFDSLLGATLEGRKWLNNDAVNFLSTFAAGALTLLLMMVL